MTIAENLRRYCANNDADMLLYSGPMTRDGVDEFVKIARSAEFRPHLMLGLSTYGGDADAAFRLANYGRRNYERVSLLVPGYCKSAGTLVAFGADTIVMSELGEFGPLDVQVVRRDDVLGRGSGLDITQALLQVGQMGSYVFGNYFRDVLRYSEGAVSTRTAAEIACQASIGLMSPIVAQIDPNQLGELARVNSTANAYATRRQRRLRDCRSTHPRLPVSRLLYRC